MEEANAHIRGPYAITRNVRRVLRATPHNVLTCYIVDQMIIVASADKPLEHTQKSTTRRGVCLKLYMAEVDDLYASQSDECLEHREFRGRM